MFRPALLAKTVLLLLTAFGCGQVQKESNEIRFKLHGTSVLSGGAQAGGCGAPAGANSRVYMTEPAQKYDATYRAWTDGAGRTWLEGGCTLEVENLDTLKLKDGRCVIAENSSMAIWGIYERVYTYLKIDQEAGAFSASARSLVIDNTQEKLETCFVAEGWVEKLP